MELKPTRPEQIEDDIFFEDETTEPQDVLTIKEEFEALHYSLTKYQLEELENKANFLRSQKMNMDGKVSSFFIATKIMGWEVAGNTYWLCDGSPVGDVLTFNPAVNDFQAKIVCRALDIRYPGDPLNACIDILDWFKINGKSILAVKQEKKDNILKTQYAQTLTKPNFNFNDYNYNKLRL